MKLTTLRTITPAPGLSMHDIFLYAAISTLYLIGGYYAFGKLHPESFQTTKPRAWILTLLLNVILLPTTTKYIRDYVWKWNERGMFSDDEQSRAATTFFIVFLILDLLFAAIDYPDRMKLLDGWIHHFVYVCFMSFILLKGWSISAMTTFPLEYPTAVMAIGNIFPSWRSDLMFGFSFFCFRILYHSYLLWKWLNVESPPMQLWPVCLMVLLLHFYWFSLWCSGPGKVLIRKMFRVSTKKAQR